MFLRIKALSRLFRINLFFQHCSPSCQARCDFKIALSSRNSGFILSQPPTFQQSIRNFQTHSPALWGLNRRQIHHGELQHSYFWGSDPQELSKSHSRVVVVEELWQALGFCLLIHKLCLPLFPLLHNSLK